MFQRDGNVTSKHIRNIFDEGELEEQSNVQNLQIANSDKPVNFCSLDVIRSVGWLIVQKILILYSQWVESNYFMVMVISHFEAMNKVESEYKKYKVKTVSDVERDYL